MSQILHLEYACTNAELEQAQSLALRKQIGGGSKWRTYLILYIMLAGALVGGYFRFREIPGTYRVLILAVALLIGVVVVLVQRKFRKNIDRAATKLEISETELAVLGPSSKVAMPWSAFSECLESPDLFVLIDRPKKVLFVIPKRVFPDESSQTWFCDQVHTGLTVPPAQFYETPIMRSTAQADSITFRFQLKFRDFVDITLASWFTWAVILAAAALVSSAFLSAGSAPDNAVHSDTEVFLFMLPFFLLFVLMAILMFSFHSWRTHAKYLILQEVAISDESIAFASAEGSGTLPWITYAFYKETWWSFILWHGSAWRCSNWVLLPKRAFASWDDLSRCRDLLERHLKRSRWFRA
jgi:hypothetical protein